MFELRPLQAGMAQIASLELPTGQVKPGQVGLVEIAVDQVHMQSGASLAHRCEVRAGQRRTFDRSAVASMFHHAVFSRFRVDVGSPFDARSKAPLATCLKSSRQ
jgi:hypothetical protein